MLLVNIITTMSNQKDERINRAKEVLSRHKEEFQKYNIIGSGIGYKDKSDEKEKEKEKDIAIVFTVKKKKSEDELLSEGIEPIPSHIEGVPTRVKEMPQGYTLRRI
jgi:hypothetical protein